MATSLNLIQAAMEKQNAYPSAEYVIGKSLQQPATNTNSGPRKLMYGLQAEQTIQISKPETPLMATGFEGQFAEYSSNYIIAEDDYEVIDKVYKNKMMYWMFVRNTKTGKVDVFARTTYEYITEMYGYEMNTEYIDALTPGDIIPKNSPIILPDSFDSALNAGTGVNLTCVYMALAETTEDPVVLSESAARKLTAPTYKNVEVMVNDNDILLNLYGDETGNYKSFPDIGEEVKHRTLCALRKEKKEDEALYTQSVQMLKERLQSDTAFLANGTVIDIDVYCNNTEYDNPQIEKYYNKTLEYSQKIVDILEKEKRKGYTLTSEADRLLYNSKSILEGKPYMTKDKVFTNLVINFVVKEEKPMEQGDKCTDRYAGKGVVSYIWPDEEMPMYERNGELFPVDIIYNSSTMVNRQNPGQTFETEINYVSDRIVERMRKMYYGASELNRSDMVPECENMILKFMNVVNPEEAFFYNEQIMEYGLQEREFFLQSVMADNALFLVCKPISGNINLTTLYNLYTEFPWVELDKLWVKQKCSDGSYRRIQTNRGVITGKKYIYRLKQIAEEKFSAVSLASTNLRGENTKTRAHKQHRSVHSDTPVRLGAMESSNLLDAADVSMRLAIVFMLLSSSFKYRRQAYQLLVGDPFKPYIKLDAEANVLATSRSAEIAKVLMKAIGLKINFNKTKKMYKAPVLLNVFEQLPDINNPYYRYGCYDQDIVQSPIIRMPFFVKNEDMDRLVKLYKKHHKDELLMSPINFNGVDNIIDADIINKVMTLISTCENMDEAEAAVKAKTPEPLAIPMHVMPVIRTGVERYEPTSNNNS